MQSIKHLIQPTVLREINENISHHGWDQMVAMIFFITLLKMWLKREKCFLKMYLKTPLKSFNQVLF